MAERPPAAPSDPQEHLLAFLSDGRSYGLPSAEVERITTHAAHVFLVGKNAYKMKRAVRYSFLDFTTLDRRRSDARSRARAEPADRAGAVSAPRAGDTRRW